MRVNPCLASHGRTEKIAMPDARSRYRTRYANATPIQVADVPDGRTGEIDAASRRHPNATCRIHGRSI
jgi:hypothetical protein